MNLRTLYILNQIGYENIQFINNEPKLIGDDKIWLIIKWLNTPFSCSKIVLAKNEKEAMKKAYEHLKYSEIGCSLLNQRYKYSVKEIKLD